MILLKYASIFAFALWGLCVHRRARLGFIVTFALTLWCLALYGCATEPAQPAHPVRDPGTKLTCADIVAARDGSYLFTGCRP